MSTTKRQDITTTEEYLRSARFEGITRLYSASQVVAQQGTIVIDYSVARQAAEAFYDQLRALFDQGKSITTFGPYSPGQAVAMKRQGIGGIYLGGWATSAKGSVNEDPGADLASYPLSQVPDEAAPIVRALLTADRNQAFFRSRMSDEEKTRTPEIDFRPFIIADADTGHGGDAHVRNLIRRFVEVGVPGYHIEDQRAGTKKCGHQGGKVLVSIDTQIKRLNAARLQLDVMRVPGIIVARTDAESATLLDNGGDERDQPFILGATNIDLPTYKVAYLALLKRLNELGLEDINGHLLYAIAEEQYECALDWLTTVGVTKRLEDCAASYLAGEIASIDSVVDQVTKSFMDAWEAAAGLKTYAEAVRDVISHYADEGERFQLDAEQWMATAARASLSQTSARAHSMGIPVIWSAEHAKTPEGYHQIRGGIEYATAKSLAVAPFCDILWMETKTANLADAKIFTDAIHAEFPDKMLAYNLSPSFNWDTTGMNDEQMREFPIELGKMGFVFNFITYGGHQIDGLAAEEFAGSLMQEGVLALARLQRKFRLVESPYRTPQSLVGGPRLDAALVASSGRTATTKAMGKGSTQFQHLVQTEVPPKLLEEWLVDWAAQVDLPAPRVELRPHRAGDTLLELRILREDGDKLANVIFAPIQDRKGHGILSIRDQNTFDAALRRKRLMTLLHLFLIHRYRSVSVHFVSPTDDVEPQADRMKSYGIYTEVNSEVGQIVVATVDPAGVANLVARDRKALDELIRRT